MTSNPWIHDEVPFEQYLTHEREKARTEARREVDRLGPANTEQRAERKEQRRTERRASLRRFGLTVLFDGVFGLGLVVGAVVGALNPDVVTRWLP